MSSSKPTTHRSNLVALGSAAVLVVYTIGYARTKSAADLFASESVDRRPVRPAPHIAPVAPVAPVAEAPKIVVAESVGEPKARKTKHDVIATAHSADSAVVPTQPQSQTLTQTQQPVTPAPASAPTSIPMPTQLPPTPPADTVAKADSAPTTHYKDGFFRGYGTSRHGDIEVELETKGGKIVYARISQCLTQYSCSWISALPDEVLLRQSAEVDFVSGATQSTNAFYLAVVQALAKAK